MPPEDGEFGMPLPGDKFNGGFLMLQENKSDLGLGLTLWFHAQDISRSSGLSESDRLVDRPRPGTRML